MTNFDRDRINTVLENYGFGRIESIVKGGRDGAYSTVFGLTPKLNSPEKVLKLYKREIGSKHLVETEFSAMNKAFNVSDTFPKPFACIAFDGCADPRFNQMKETLYGIVIEKFEPVVFNNPPSEIEVLKLAKDILEELVSLHSIGKFRHGDIKLSNVLICPRKNKYSLIDFNTSDTRYSAESTITSYSLQGSKYYVDPQSLMNNAPGKYSYSPRSDIYALGMTLRLLLNDNKQEYSFNSEPTISQLINAKKQLKVFKSSKYSNELCEIVTKATAFERDDRFNTANDMLDAVNSLINRSNAENEKTTVYSVVCNDKTFVPEHSNRNNLALPADSNSNAINLNKSLSQRKKENIIKAIRCGDYNGALKLLEKTNFLYTDFLKGCAYLGRRDLFAAEKAFKSGNDKMSYYMLYVINSDKFPEHADNYLRTAAEMGSPPALFVYGYKLYKSRNTTSRTDGLKLIIKSAEMKYWDAYRYLCKLQKRGEISLNLLNNLETTGLTNSLSSFAN